jgi:hypothetical protein
MKAGQEAVALPRRIPQPAEDREHKRGVDREHGPLLREACVEDGAGVRVLDLAADQL